MKNRMILFALWLFALVGISFYGGPITYGFFWMITLIPVISLIYLLCVFWRFRIYQRIDWKTLVCDQAVPFYFTLQNEDFFAFAGIKVHFFAPLSSIHGIDPEEEYELLPHTGVQKQTSLICHYRGEYEVGIQYVEVWDFLRMFHLTFKNPETLKVKVRPKLTYLEQVKQGDMVTPIFRESQMNPEDTDVLVREYIPGDDVRRIHWGMFARYQKPMVRNRIGIQQQGVTIIMSTWRGSEDMLRYLPIENKILEITLALGLYYVKNQTPVNILYQKEQLHTIHVDCLEHFEDCYDELSEVWFQQEQKEEKLYSILEDGRLPGSRTVFLVVETWQETNYALAEKLNEQQIPVVIYLVTDQAMEKLPRPVYTTLICVDRESKIEEVLG